MIGSAIHIITGVIYKLYPGLFDSNKKKRLFEICLLFFIYLFATQLGLQMDLTKLLENWPLKPSQQWKHSISHSLLRRHPVILLQKSYTTSCNRVNWIWGDTFIKLYIIMYISKMLTGLRHPSLAATVQVAEDFASVSLDSSSVMALNLC